MKKYLIFLLFSLLLLITSCQSHNITFIESSKVSCYEDLAVSSRTFYLNIYTSTNITDLKIKDHSNIEYSDIVFKTNALYIYENEEVDAIFYQFKITLANIQLSITHLTFVNNGIEYILEIGKYQLIKMPQTNNYITGIITITNNNQVIIYIHNDLDRTIYLSKISVYLINHSMFKFNKIIPSDSDIYEGATRIFSVGSLTIPENLTMVSGLLKIEFTTNVKEYVIYVNYCYNKSLEVLKKEPNLRFFFHIFYIVHISVYLK
jgi:hypothetical protein